MTNMGLQAFPNQTIQTQPSVPQILSHKSTNKSTNTNTKAIELFDIPESDIIPKQTKALRMLPVSITDQKYMIRLLIKYEQDYLQMARDIKLNNMQYTPSQLKKMGARFCLLTKEQRRVEIPEHVLNYMC